MIHFLSEARGQHHGYVPPDMAIRMQSDHPLLFTRSSGLDLAQQSDLKHFSLRQFSVHEFDL